MNSAGADHCFNIDPDHSVLMFSTSEGKPADDGSGCHSPYTEALLEEFFVEGRRLSDVNDSIKKTLRPQKQTPYIIGSSPVVIFPCPGPCSNHTKHTACIADTGARDFWVRHFDDVSLAPQWP